MELYAALCLAINYSNSLQRQLQRDIINVSDQQKTDVILFIKRPPCTLYPCITLKLFASGTATRLFPLTRSSGFQDCLVCEQWNMMKTGCLAFFFFLSKTYITNIDVSGKELINKPIPTPKSKSKEKKKQF